MTMLSQDEVEAIAAPILARHDAPGAGIAIAAAGEQRTFPTGVRERGKPEAVTADTHYQLASCSKAYTAAAVGTLVDRGELGWDDPVRRHIPEFRLYDEHVSALCTLRDLLTMRLGLKPEGVLYWGRNGELGTDVLLSRLHHVGPVAGFREKFTYYNPAYTLLTEVIARRTKTPFADYLSDAVLKPAGLVDTFVEEGRIEPRGPHAPPHVLLDEGVVPLGEARCGGRIGESCVYSSARDAARWLALQLGSGTIEGRQVVSATAIGEMHRPQVLAGAAKALGHDFIAYGMGWQCRDTPQGMILLHEGGEFGVSTYTLMSLDHQAGVAVYLNANIPAASRAIAHTLLDRLTGAPAKDWAAHFDGMAEQERRNMEAAVTSALPIVDGADIAPADIAGAYFDPANGVVEVRQTPEGLAMQVLDGWIYDAALTPLGGGVYTGVCGYLGTQSLGRKINRVRFVREGQAIWLETFGLGRLRKL